jgi:CRP/FNR family transcriptional regulator
MTALLLHTTTARRRLAPAPRRPAAVPRPIALQLLAGRRLLAGQVLIQGQSVFRQLYTVVSGTLKSSTPAPDGREQVCAFHMLGDVLGTDGMADDRHHNEVIALEDSHVQPLHAALAGSDMRRILGQEIARCQLHLLLLGQLTALERVGAFLLDLSQRAHARGESATLLLLTMPRSDIGSYLGVTLETVSRTLSHLKDSGCIDVHSRRVCIHDRAAFGRQFALRGAGPRA